MKQNCNCSPKKCEVKLQKHSNHLAGKAEIPKNGQDLRSRIRTGTNLLIFVCLKERTLNKNKYENQTISFNSTRQPVFSNSF
jgi:hypothetical protein